MPYSLRGNNDGRILTRRASRDDAEAIALALHEASGEACVLTDLDTGEEMLLFPITESPRDVSGLPKTHKELDQQLKAAGIVAPKKASVTEKRALLAPVPPAESR